MRRARLLRGARRSPTRGSARADPRQQRPVGPPGVEEGSDPVVAEGTEAEGRPLHPLDEIVGRFGRAVGHMRVAVDPIPLQIRSAIYARRIVT